MSRRFCACLLFTLAYLLWTAALVTACTLAWTPPTTNVDGSPIGPLGGYSLYFRQVGATTFVRQADTISPAVSSVTITCQHGDYYLTAWYYLELQSDPSNIVRAKKPRPGTLLTVAP